MATSATLTQGNIYKTLITFAVPYLIANLIQALYGAVDMVVVGWFSDASGISAVSIGSQVMQIVTSLVSGLTLGGTILIGQYLGAEKEEDTVETIGTTLTLFAAAAIVFTVVMLCTVTPILQVLKTPAQAFEQAYQYVWIASCGIFFIFGYNAISAILRGMGDSKRPLVFIAVACVANIGLDLLFVGVFHMGAAGAALATILSQGISMVTAVVSLSRRNFLFSFHLTNFRIRKDKALRLLKIGLPVSLQETMVNLSFLFISAIINAMGVVASAAVGICGKFDAFAMLPASAFSAAISAIAAQNIGAGQPHRAKKSLYASILSAFICSLFFFVWAQIAPLTIPALFKGDSAVCAAGAEYLRSFSFDFIFVSFGFCLNGFFNGCGRTTFAMLNGIASTVFLRVPLAYVLSRMFPSSLVGIGAAAPIATVVSIVVAWFYLRTNRWQKPVI